MSYESFLARWSIYLNSHNKDVAEGNAELPLEPQVEENEVDSSIVDISQSTEGQVDHP